MKVTDSARPTKRCEESDRVGVEPRSGATWLAWTVVAGLALLLVWVATRRLLNFDESLALRAGWLLVAGIEAQPSFLMPITLMLGALAHSVTDPGTVFVTARLACALGVLGALAYLSLSPGLERRQRPLFLMLVLGSGGFAAHGLEFRYDAAILSALMLSLAWILRGTPRHMLLVGLAAAWLSMHHLKGLVFASGVLCVALFAIRIEQVERQRKIIRLGLGVASGWFAWLAVVLAIGKKAALFETYTLFSRVAAAQERRFAGDALGTYLVKDFVWWMVALVGLLAAIRLRGETNRAVRFGLPFCAMALGFLFIHPMPWSYMLATVVPFVALVASMGLSHLRRRWRLVMISIVVLCAVAPWSALFQSALRNMDSQVQSLRFLKSHAQPADQAFDPSGLAYFLEPCIEEWYLDSLFARYAQTGLWMTTLSDAGGATSCAWLVHTYRMSFLPPKLAEAFDGRYRLVARGIAVDAGLKSAHGLADSTDRGGLLSFGW